MDRKRASGAAADAFFVAHRRRLRGECMRKSSTGLHIPFIEARYP
jgi:hypothetical protein